MSRPDLVSLQGELFLAKYVNSVAAGLLTVGNMPDLKLAISSEATEHFTSKDGTRAKDAVLRKATGVRVSGTLEELNKQNRDIIFSGTTTESTSATITDKSIGSVQTGQMINLGHRNLSGVTFKDGSNAAVDASNYTLDAAFGTVIFNQAVTGEVTWSGTAGVVSRTTIATDIGNEYRLFFKGIDTYSGDKVALELWRVELSPDTEFDLINEEFAQFSIEGEALADISKASDPTFGSFGCIERFNFTG